MAMAMAMAATASSSSSSLSTLTAGAPTLRGGLTPLLAAPLPLPLPLRPRRSLRGRVSLTCPPRGGPPSVARAAKSAAETTVRSPEWPTSSSSSSSASSSAASAMAAAVIAATAAWTDSAAAAEEMMKVAASASASASDARGTLLLLPVVPAVAWVVYNILRPALSQLERMRGARGVAFWAGLGLGVGVGVAGVWQAPHAQAATEDVLGLGMGGSVFELGAAAAQSDSRGSIILVVLLPAVLWVLYNILRPALNQLDRMRR